MSEIRYRLCWKMALPSWDKRKKKPVKFEGSMDGGIYPYKDKEELQYIADNLNRTYGDGTHWVEEIPQ